MHAPTLGNWLAFFTSIGCGSIYVIWPEATIAIYILGFSIAGCLASIFWWFYKNFQLTLPFKRRNTLPTQEVSNNSNKRVPLISLLAEVEKDDFLYKDDEYPILKFSAALRQAGLDGDLTFWGRPKRYSMEESIKSEPLNEIPKSHWKDFEINILAAYDLKKPFDGPQYIGKNNFVLQTHTSRIDNKNEKPYADLHIDAMQVTIWKNNLLKGFNMET